MKKHKSICQGCMSVVQFTKCDVPPIKDGKTCPCSLCLVKTMCEDPCEEFKIYSDWHSRLHNDKKYLEYHKGDEI